MIELKGSSSQDDFSSMGYHLHDAVFFCYTYQCNIQCAHCCFKCSPKRIEKMPVDEARRVVKGVFSSGKSYIELWGGEPFLNYPELLELTAFCSSSGLKVGIDTNGFWGKVLGSAKEKLQELADAGLNRILVSIDTFHNKFIPVEHALNVIRAAKEVGIDSRVWFCRSFDDEKDLVLLNQVKKETELIYIIDTISTGRYARSDNLSIDELEPCKALFFSILPNGDTFVCCGVDYEKKSIADTPLYMGNCITEDPVDVLKKKNMFGMEAFFDPDSPIWYKHFLKQAPYEKMFENKRFNHICELCQDMLHIEEIRNQVTNYNRSTL